MFSILNNAKPSKGSQNPWSGKFLFRAAVAACQNALTRLLGLQAIDLQEFTRAFGRPSGLRIAPLLLRTDRRRYVRGS